MKKIYKYPTGAEVPEGATYLKTIVQTKEERTSGGAVYDCYYVWHYFLVEVEEDNKKNI